jgi:hypothetical protein
VFCNFGAFGRTVTPARARIARVLISMSCLGTWQLPESGRFKSNLSSGILLASETLLEAWW